MQMTPGEICAMYRDSRYKSSQIGILAELNACSRGVIVHILRAGGYAIKETVSRRLKDKPSIKMQWTAERLAELERLLNRGLTAAQAGCHFGVSRNSIWQTVRYYRIRRGKAA